MGSRDTPQVPLRGPAQPLAAVRSGACEAMPRKQCALTHVGSATACASAQSCALGKAGAGRRAQPVRRMRRTHAVEGPVNPYPPSRGHCVGAHGKSRLLAAFLLRAAEHGSAKTKPRPGRAERCSAAVALALALALAPPPLTAPGPPTNCRGSVGVGLRGPEPHGCGDGAYRGEGALLARHCLACARTHSRQRLGRAAERDLQRAP